MSAYDERELTRLGLAARTLPRHVGIIMDGNGRWAAARGLARAAGHKAGVERLREIIRFSSDVGVETLSIYAFSTENWARPIAEVDILMSLFMEYFNSEVAVLHKNNVRIRTLGDTSRFSDAMKDSIARAVALTAANDGLKFNIALNYGGREEVVRAVKKLAKAAKDGLVSIDEIDGEMLMNALYTAGTGDVDLVIRTSGEMRLSNFLPLQSAYAELVFSKVNWPDFTVDEYIKTLVEYANRNRRFGGLE